MKKYAMLFAFTAAAIVLIAVAGNSVKGSVIRVTAIGVVPTVVEDTVTCNGRVESYPGNNIYASRPGIVQKVYVKSGDKVTAGQAIMDILPLSSASSAAPSSASTPDYSKAYEAYSAYLKSHGSALPDGAPSSLPGEQDAASSAASDTQTIESQEYTLFATTSGNVESVSPSSSGYSIGTSSPAAVIRNNNSVQVRLSVDESQISDLKVGQKVQISGVGFKNSVYSGSIKSISGEAKQTILTTGQETVVEVIASVSNPGNDIKPGFTAKAKITTSHNSRVLSVPYEAVREDSEENEYVFRVVNGKAEKVKVTAGKEFDAGVEVKSGIKAGDVVITDPDDVSDGAKVVVVGTAAGETHE